MPWHVSQNDECPSDKPWAVIKDDDGTVVGCHATEEAAQEQVAALHASEDDAQASIEMSVSDDADITTLAEELVSSTLAAAGITLAKPSPGTPADRRLKENKKRKPRKDRKDFTSDEQFCPPGFHAMPDGSCMPDDEMGQAALSGPFQGWTGILAIEGMETGDGREFAPESLEWPDPPLPLMWQESSEPQHGHSMVVGRIDRIERQGTEIRGWGIIDISSEEGIKVVAQIEAGLAGGVSVDVDSVKETDVELVFPDDPESESVGSDEDDEVITLFGPPPEKVVFHRGRIRGATLVALPAFVEARLHLIDDDEIAMAMRGVFAAVGTHSTSLDDTGGWDADMNERRLPATMTADVAQGAFAWVAASDEIGLDDVRFLHHNIDSKGRPAAANLVACSNGVGVLNGVRGGTTIPTADRQGVYAHLVAHLRDAGREPPMLATVQETLVAAGGPLYPPAKWFKDPALRGPTAMTIDKDGRVFGHLALWNSCHTTFPNKCVRPPREGDYPFFVKGEIETDDGQLTGVGQITMGTGHAPLQLGAMPATDHYDNTGSAVVDATVGEDRWGIWISGCLRPSITELQVRELRAGALSGDWRRIGSKLRLVAVLAVNVPGYPIPRMRASLAADEVASLVAAGIPTEARRERYRQANAETLSDGTIRVRRASALVKVKEVN